MYITIEKYIALFGNIEASVFNRLAYDACKYIDKHTTGVDGVKKLKTYFPSDADSVAAVERCSAEIVNALMQIHEAEKSASVGRGYTQTENGLQGKIITSMSAGNESISFSETSGQKTPIDLAISDLSARDNLICNIIREYLSGEKDANGVNLLYMGVYPRV